MTETGTTAPGVTWTELAASAPRIAERGRELLYRTGEGAGLIATVREGAPPRIHPVNVGIVDGALCTFFLASPKRTDLERDGRYALHAHVDPAAPDEFAVRGTARLVADPAVRERVAAGWPFTPDDTFALFELRISSAVLGERAADEWPPRYTTWRHATE